MEDFFNLLWPSQKYLNFTIITEIKHLKQLQIKSVTDYTVSNQQYVNYGLDMRMLIGDELAKIQCIILKRTFANHKSTA